MKNFNAPEYASCVGAVMAILSSFTLNEWAMLVGIITGIGTWLFALQRRIEERREHLARMSQMSGECDIDDGAAR